MDARAKEQVDLRAARDALAAARESAMIALRAYSETFGQYDKRTIDLRYKSVVLGIDAHIQMLDELIV